MKYIEIETTEALYTLIKANNHLECYAFQNLDFTPLQELLVHTTFNDCVFLGCITPPILTPKLISSLIFPTIDDVPYNTFKNSLYTPKTLFDNYTKGNSSSYENTTDKIIYNHYLKTGKEASDIKETLARRLHDHAITDALYDFLASYNEKKIVAIMGGHSLLRNDNGYFEVAQISKQLTEQGYLMISGGGPGAMEATHLGAWFAGKTENELKEAVQILSLAPSYKDALWLDKSFEVLDKFPISEFESVGIPTWLYGHEPPTPFATKIAKYFANSVREDGLLAIAKGGIIFSPGSAGTIQEIFQDATQNHYLSFGYASPMVFLNSDYWTNSRPIYPLFEQMIAEGKYQNIILSKCDTCKEVIHEIKKFTS